MYIGLFQKQVTVLKIFEKKCKMIIKSPEGNKRSSGYPVGCFGVFLPFRIEFQFLLGRLPERGRKKGQRIDERKISKHSTHFVLLLSKFAGSPGTEITHHDHPDVSVYSVF